MAHRIAFAFPGPGSQLTAPVPVRFTDSVATLVVRRTEKTLAVYNVEDHETLEKTVRALGVAA